MWFKIILIEILLIASTVHCANILYMAVLPSPSHHIWNSAIINELALRGHNVTVLSPYSESNPPAGAHYIGFEQTFAITHNFMKSAFNANGPTDPFHEGYLLQDAFSQICHNAVESNGFQKLIDYPNDFKFDLIINDFTVGSCLLPFLHKFNYPPLISVTAYGHPSYLNDLIGGHQYYAYVPHDSLRFDDDITFSERFYNFLVFIWEKLLFEFYLTPTLDAIAAKHFGPNVPSMRELEQRTALAFVNTNPAMDYANSLPSNVIPVAGVHVREPKALPENLKAFIESARKGVVVFSLGTNLLSTFLPEGKRKLFLNVFSELPDYHFLWKFETNTSLSDLPKNVRIEPWLPQSDVIAHPRVKAIFFHGGMLTTQETIWRGIPMIIMPFVLDQHQNLIKTKKLGISEGVDYHSLNETQIKSALLKVLEDPSYALNAKKWSARYKDQKEKPLERAIWWIEWLMRQPDCDYLKSPVLRLGFVAGNSYDIIACVLLFFVLFVIVFIKLVYFCTFKYTTKIHILKHRKME